MKNVICEDRYEYGPEIFEYIEEGLFFCVKEKYLKKDKSKFIPDEFVGLYRECFPGEPYDGFKVIGERTVYLVKVEE